jgi:hypothetical protein
LVRPVKSRLAKFLGLSFSEQRLLVAAWLVLAAVRLGLWLFPFSLVRRLPARMERPASERSGVRRPSESRVAWSIGVASRYVPVATCLTQALAAQGLLGWFGYQVSLRVGVARGKGGVLEAHAWVESGGKVLLGGSESELKRFSVLRPLDGNDL